MAVKKSFYSYRQEVEKMIANGIGNKEQFDAAIPVLVELEDKIETMEQNTLKSLKNLAKSLCNMASDYAEKHEKTVFENGKLILEANGVKSGNVVIGRKRYHFTDSYGPLKRMDGSDMSQDFLSGLPKEWTKAKFELDTTGIKRKGVPLDKLNDFGLYRPAKYEWSLGSDPDAAESGE